MLVFTFPRVGRLLRRSGADWVLGAAGALGTGLLLPLAVALRPGHHFRLPPIDPLLVFLALWSGLSGFFGVKAWRRLWRAGRTPLERMVYDHGVRGFGALMYLVTPLTVLLICLFVLDLPRGLSEFAFLAALEFTVLMIALPLWLCGGYLFGNIMSGGLSQHDLRREPDGLPPAA